MPIERWTPSRTVSKQEEFLLKRLTRTKKLFGFLRRHRHELFDAAFQDELAAMYRDTGAGREPVNPALMAMAVLLQGYVGASDAEAVELTVVDLRWQMVLDRLGATTTAFSQGALQDFRQRLIRTEMDRRLLERTVELARLTQEFDWKKLPGAIRVAMDSSPLIGAGRVEDTINLLAHAARDVVACIAGLVGRSEEQIAKEAGIPLLLEASAKKALDRNWGKHRKFKRGARLRLVPTSCASSRSPSCVAWPPSPRPPYAHVVRYYGLLAHNAKGRNLLPPAPPSPRGLRAEAALRAKLSHHSREGQVSSPCAPSEANHVSSASAIASLAPTLAPPSPEPLELQDGAGLAAPAAAPRPARKALPWHELLRRVFAFDVRICPRCAGPMMVLAYLTERAPPQGVQGRSSGRLQQPREHGALALRAGAFGCRSRTTSSG